MQFSVTKLFRISVAFAMFAAAIIVNAAPAGKTYTEDEFINAFSGKSKKVVMEK